MEIPIPSSFKGDFLYHRHVRRSSAPLHQDSCQPIFQHLAQLQCPNNHKLLCFLIGRETVIREKSFSFLKIYIHVMVRLSVCRSNNFLLPHRWKWNTSYIENCYLCLQFIKISVFIPNLLPGDDSKWLTLFSSFPFYSHNNVMQVWLTMWDRFQGWPAILHGRMGFQCWLFWPSNHYLFIIYI